MGAVDVTDGLEALEPIFGTFASRFSPNVAKVPGNVYLKGGQDLHPPGINVA